MLKSIKHILMSILCFGLFIGMSQFARSQLTSERNHPILQVLNQLHPIKNVNARDNRHYQHKQYKAKRYNKHRRQYRSNKAKHRTDYNNNRYYKAHNKGYYKNKRYYKNRGYYRNGRVVRYGGKRYYRYYDGYGYRRYPVYYNRPYNNPYGACFSLSVNGGYIQFCNGKRYNRY